MRLGVNSRLRSLTAWDEIVADLRILLLSGRRRGERASGAKRALARPVFHGELHRVGVAFVLSVLAGKGVEMAGGAGGVLGFGWLVGLVEGCFGSGSRRGGLMIELGWKQWVGDGSFAFVVARFFLFLFAIFAVSCHRCTLYLDEIDRFHEYIR